MGGTFSGLGTFRMHVIQNSQVYVRWPSCLCIVNIAQKNVFKYIDYIAIDIYICMGTKYALTRG
jgi:hypothetical protein